jgi:hypothetical protein
VIGKLAGTHPPSVDQIAVTTRGWCGLLEPGQQISGKFGVAGAADGIETGRYLRSIGRFGRGPDAPGRRFGVSVSFVTDGGGVAEGLWLAGEAYLSTQDAGP